MVRLAGYSPFLTKGYRMTMKGDRGDKIPNRDLPWYDREPETIGDWTINLSATLVFIFILAGLNSIFSG